MKNVTIPDAVVLCFSFRIISKTFFWITYSRCHKKIVWKLFAKKFILFCWLFYFAFIEICENFTSWSLRDFRMKWRDSSIWWIWLIFKLFTLQGLPIWFSYRGMFNSSCTFTHRQQTIWIIRHCFVEQKFRMMCFENLFNFNHVIVGDRIENALST